MTEFAFWRLFTFFLHCRLTLVSMVLDELCLCLNIWDSELFPCLSCWSWQFNRLISRGGAFVSSYLCYLCLRDHGAVAWFWVQKLLPGHWGPGHLGLEAPPPWWVDSMGGGELGLWALSTASLLLKATSPTIFFDTSLLPLLGSAPKVAEGMQVCKSTALLPC